MFKKTFLTLGVLACRRCRSASASAQADGRLETLPLGQYRCSLPGSADGQAWISVEGMDFAIGNASSYFAAGGSGTYLATEKTVTFTRGPLKGTKFLRRGPSMLQKIEEDGTPGRLRCVRVRPLRVGSSVVYWPRLVRSGYGFTAFAGSHHSASSVVRRIAKCRCGASGSALPVLPTVPRRWPRRIRIPSFRPGAYSDQMRVIMDRLAVAGTDIDGRPARIRAEQLFDHARSGGDDRRSFGGHDVDRLVQPLTARALVAVGVAEIGSPHIQNGDQELRPLVRSRGRDVIAIERRSHSAPALSTIGSGAAFRWNGRRQGTGRSICRARSLPLAGAGRIFHETAPGDNPDGRRQGGGDDDGE